MPFIIMESLTTQQRILIVQIYYENNRSKTTTFRKLRESFGRHGRPTERAIGKIIDRFEETGSVEGRRPYQHVHPVRTPDAVAAVSESVRNEPSTSTRHRSQELNISRTTLRRILHVDLHLHPYKIQLTQKLRPPDHLNRRRFVNWMLERNEGFSSKIIFSDEAHFHLNGYVNKQNCRIWGAENPHVIHEAELHPPRVTVWCGLWAGGIIGPFFFENEQENALTVNGERYRNMLTGFLWPKLNELRVNDLWFQQDGATCHANRATIHLLSTKFADRIISRNCEVPWPPRSPDLTPLDYVLWGYLKGKVYANHPQTIQQLKNNIRAEIEVIDPLLLEKVIENFDVRMQACRRSRGGHMNDIVFHT